MHFVTAVYRFFPVAIPDELKSRLKTLANELGIRGLAIVAPEGLNGTFSSDRSEGLLAFQNELRAITGDPDLEFKNAQSKRAPFDRFTVKVRPEIVSLGTPELRPSAKSDHHLSPEEWDQVLETENDVVLVDTRNHYEYELGTFPGSLNPQTRKFSEFPEFMRSQDISKDRKIMIFCTGGIRCEKGILELRRQGYENVYQLKGGILNYLKERPNRNFKGECLVFDHRVAVDQHLQPTSVYSWCPHCGNPADLEIVCVRCSKSARVCRSCQNQEAKSNLCSKNCRHIQRRLVSKQQF